MIVDSISVSSCRRHRCCCVRPISIAAAAPVWNWKQTFWWDLSKKLLAGWSGSISKCMEWMAVLCTTVGTYLYSTVLDCVDGSCTTHAVYCDFLSEWMTGRALLWTSQWTNLPSPSRKTKWPWSTGQLIAVVLLYSSGQDICQVDLDEVCITIIIQIF